MACCDQHALNRLKGWLVSATVQMETAEGTGLDQPVAVTAMIIVGTCCGHLALMRLGFSHPGRSCVRVSFAQHVNVSLASTLALCTRAHGVLGPGIQSDS